jgi:hypothetical protein
MSKTKKKYEEKQEKEKQSKRRRRNRGRRKWRERGRANIFNSKQAKKKRNARQDVTERKLLVAEECLLWQKSAEKELTHSHTPMRC